MTISFLNRCSFLPTAGGTADFVVSSAINGGYTPANCLDPAVIDGGTYHYFAATSDNTQHEEGDGVYTAGTTTLTRATIRNSSNSGSKVNFTVAPIVTMGGPVATDPVTALTAATTFYVRTVPATISLSNGSPCNVSWTSHGLHVNDPVVFSSPYDRSSVTITIASPAVITYNNHGYVLNDPVSFDTSGALPTGLATATTYFVTAPATNTFEVASVANGSAMSTSGSQSGTQYAWRNNTIPSGVTDGQIYFVKTVVDANTFTFASVASGAAINTTTAQAGKIIGQTGNDNNNGLAQTRTGALMTIGAAWAKICATNLNNNAVTVNCAHGTYYGGGFSGSSSALNISADSDSSPNFCSDPATANVPVKWFGSGDVTFLGDASNPDGVVWRSNSTVAEIDAGCSFSGTLAFKGLRLEYSNGSNGFGSDVFQNFGFNTIILDTINFGTGTNGRGNKIGVKEGTCQLNNPCQVFLTNNTGGSFISVSGIGQFFKNDQVAITGVNNPAFNTIYQATDTGFIKCQLNTYAGNWNYSTIAGCDGQGYIHNHQGQNPQPDPGAAPVVNDRAFYFEFTTPNAQTSAMHGSPGVPIDLFYLTFVPSTTFTKTLNNSHGHVIIQPTSTLSSGTIMMSPNPWFGQQVNIRTSQAITSMTFSGNSAIATQTIVGAPSSLTAGQGVNAFWMGTVATWYFSN